MLTLWAYVSTADIELGEGPDDDLVCRSSAPRNFWSPELLLFLSCADEDNNIAQEIADQLSSDAASVSSTQGSVVRRLSGLPSEPELAIQQADAFLALVSPYSMASTLCRQERELALYREHRMHQAGIAKSFVQVLQIRETPHHEAGSLRGQPWFDLTSGIPSEGLLKALADNLEPSGFSGGDSAAGNGGTERGRSPDFRNRKRELDAVADGIASGLQLFWVVVAPPQLGKSWFLNEISSRVNGALPRRCSVELVDVHELRPEVIVDADAILRLLFGVTSRNDQRPVDLGEIVNKINGRMHLCLLDGAELLTRDTIHRLRNLLGQINDRLARRIDRSARFALVAASRTDAEWKGMIPGPRLEILPLTEFSEEVVADELRKAADETGFFLETRRLEHIARRVHRFSEGLPALLAGCIAWVQEQSFDIDGLDDATTLRDIAGPYIEQSLLSPNSLRIGDKLPGPGELAVIRLALQLISPYRILTNSHVDHCAREPSLREAMDALDWSVRDLWDAISGIDLLYRPQRGPWQGIHRPVRRLLCKYWRATEPSRRDAHREAARFTRDYLREQMGSDQWRVVLECLWHEAHAAGIATMGGSVSPTVGAADRLVRLCMELVAGLRHAPPEVLSERRKFAVASLRDDVEFEEDVRHVPGLYDRFVNAVSEPPLGARS